MGGGISFQVAEAEIGHSRAGAGIDLRDLALDPDLAEAADPLRDLVVDVVQRLRILGAGLQAHGSHPTSHPSQAGGMTTALTPNMGT